MEKFNRIKFSSQKIQEEPVIGKTLKSTYPTKIALCSYGGLTRGREYKVIRKGYDFFLIKLQGRPFFAPKWVFE